MTDAKALVEFEERVLERKGSRLHALVGGPAGAPGLVLVHGLGGSRSNWALLAPALARRRRVLVVDLPGHGRSEPLPAAPSLEPYAERVVAFAEQEGLVPADYVGHSLGGLVSLRVALQRPETVRRVVLAAGAGITSSTRYAERALAFLGWLQPGRRISPHWEAVARSAALKRLVLGHWMTHSPEDLGREAVGALLRDVNLNTDTDGAWRALTRDDPRTDLDRVAAPALVLWGAEDRQLPLADAFDYARRLRAPVRVIPACGHLLIVERPDACLDAIAAFLG